MAQQKQLQQAVLIKGVCAVCQVSKGTIISKAKPINVSAFYTSILMDTKIHFQRQKELDGGQLKFHGLITKPIEHKSEIIYVNSVYLGKKTTFPFYKV